MLVEVCILLDGVFEVFGLLGMFKTKGLFEYLFLVILFISDMFGGVEFVGDEEDEEEECVVVVLLKKVVVV